MSDTELDALLRMLQTSHMLPAPPALEPKSWSLATAAYHTCGLDGGGSLGDTKHEREKLGGGVPSRAGQVFLAATLFAFTILVGWRKFKPCVESA